MIIKCVAYQNGNSLGDISVDDISEILKQEDTFVWVGLHEPNDDLLNSMFKFLVILRLSLLKNHREAWYCNDVEDSKRPKSFPIMCFSDGTN